MNDLDTAVQKNSRDSEAYFHRGRVYLTQHKYEEAHTDLQEAITLDPSKADYYSARGESYEALQDFEKALSDFETALGMDINQARAYLGRGIVKRQQGEYNESLSDLRKALTVDPQLLHEGNKEIGKTLRAMGLHKKAINAFEKSLLSSPECSECWSSLASTLAEIHPLEAVPGLLRKVVLPPSRKNQAAAFRAVALNDLELYEDALVDFGKALAIHGDEAWVLARRADAYFALNREESALHDYQRAVNTDPSLAKNLSFKIGICLTRLRRFNDAITYFASDSDSDADVGELSRYHHAIAQFYANGPIMAEIYIHRATSQLENSSEEKPALYLYCIGGLAALQNEKEDALSFLEKAIERDVSVIDFVHGDPAWDSIRQDSRFLEMIDLGSAGSPDG